MSKKQVYFASLTQCNEDCLFCVKRGENFKSQFLNTRESKEKIAKYADEGWEELLFDGGEPTLRDDLPELIRFAQKQGFEQAAVLTNAVKLSEEEWAEEIIKAPNRKGPADNFLSFGVSLHSHRKEISEKLVGTKDTFEKTLKGVNNILDWDVPVSFYHVITKYNFKDLPQFVDFVNSEFPKVKDICFSFIYPSGAALENKQIFPQLSKVSSFLGEAFNRIDKYGMNFSLATCGIMPLCFLEGYEEVPVNQQKVESPEDVQVVDPNKSEGYRLASEKFHQRTKIKSSKCSLCMLDGLCPGIWNVYAQIYGVEELEPVLDAENYREIKLDFEKLTEDIESKKQTLRGSEEIFFLECRITSRNQDKISKVVDFIEWMDEEELNYIIKRPLPLIEGKEEEEYERLGIPLNCEECLDLFSVEKESGEVYFCNGVLAGTREQFSSRKDLVSIFRESTPNSKSEYFQDCWMRSLMERGDKDNKHE